MTSQTGGCLCGALRFAVTTPPLWVTACFCDFCQRATGTMGIVEPIFDVTAFAMTRGEARVYSHVSGGSGKQVHIHFCPTCSAKTNLTFERWPDRLGVYSGAFDTPGWFAFTPETAKYIFVDEAVRGTVVPPGFKTFARHATDSDGAPLEPVIHQTYLHVR
jgi:hypothetical protein